MRFHSDPMFHLRENTVAVLLNIVLMEKPRAAFRVPASHPLPTIQPAMPTQTINTRQTDPQSPCRFTRGNPALWDAFVLAWLAARLCRLQSQISPPERLTIFLLLFLQAQSLLILFVIPQGSRRSTNRAFLCPVYVSQAQESVLVSPSERV